ncbi:DNA cytosine methyltransferase [Thermococcus barophilus]|nr:DNA cytosine methyltransferase [Thermococcus barophilus]
MKSGYSFMDLFAAPGGFSLGMVLAGLNPQAAVDIDYHGIRTYIHNFREAMKFDTTGILEDLQKLPPEKLAKESGISKGDVDVIIGGPPCQGFSLAGRVKIANLAKNGKKKDVTNHNPRFIDDPRNILYKEFVRMIKYFQPKMFIMENVPGMMSHRNGKTVEEIIHDFQKIGYVIPRSETNENPRILNAADFGVPQLRRRIFFVGIHKDEPSLVEEFKWPVSTHADPEAPNRQNPVDLGSNPDFPKKQYVTVGQAIGDLPTPFVAKKAGMEDIPIPHVINPFSEYQKWARKRVPFWDGLIHNHLARPHTERDIKTFTHMKEGDTWKDLPDEIKAWYGYRSDIFPDKFKKLIWNRPSWTITAHLQKDGYRYIHPVQPRTLTPREAARLQSFPDWFIFKGPRTAQYRQIGNAVPPLLAAALGLAIIATFEGWEVKKLWKKQLRILER